MRFLSTVSALMISVSIATAQDKLNSLKPPTSPASSILGLQPISVLTPKSHQALETAIYSNFVEGGSVNIPDDFALEVTPYWLSDHGLSIQEYLYPKSGWEQFIRNLSLSVASTQQFLLGDSTRTKSLGLGLRSSFYFPAKKDKETVNSLIASLGLTATVQARIGAQVMEVAAEQEDFEAFWTHMREFLLRTLSGTMDVEGGELEQLEARIYGSAKELSSYDPDNTVGFLQDFMSIVDREIKGREIFDATKEYIENRYGLSIDIAYANMINFPTNTFEFSMVPRQSLWIAPVYRFSNNISFLSMASVLRYQWYDVDFYSRYFEDVQAFGNNLDYGISVSGKFNRMSIQFEVVGRQSRTLVPSGTDSNGDELYRKKSGSDLQYIGSINYNVTDQIILSFNLGSQFKPLENAKNTLVSLLSLNFGFGAPDQNDLDMERTMETNP